MKKFLNKETSIKEGEKNITYAELVSLCVNRPLREGWTVNDIKVRSAVLKKMEEARIYVPSADMQEGVKESDFETELEDAHMEVIKECVGNMKWGLIHEDIIHFDEYIKSIK